MADGLRLPPSTVVAGMSIDVAELLRLRGSSRPVFSVTTGDWLRGEFFLFGVFSPEEGPLVARWESEVGERNPVVAWESEEGWPPEAEAVFDDVGSVSGELICERLKESESLGALSIVEAGVLA